MAKARGWIWVAMGFTLAIALVCLVMGFVIQSRPAVVENWTIYIESLSPEQKLLVLSSAQRYTASKEFTAKILAIVQVKASIEIEAWADFYYVIDASDPAQWKIAWNPGFPKIYTNEKIKVTNTMK